MPQKSLALLFLGVLLSPGEEPFHPVIPKTWEAAALEATQFPLAQAKYSPVQQPADYYYRMKPRVIYKTYPIYHPDREPNGYLDWLKQQEPEVVFDPVRLRTEEDWIRAGELVFEFANTQPLETRFMSRLRDRAWYEASAVPVSKEGIYPYARYTIRQKGVVEVTQGHCGTCHTRVLPDGAVVKGAQGNGNSGRVEAAVKAYAGSLTQNMTQAQIDTFRSRIFGAPWLGPDDPAALRKAITEAQEDALIRGFPSSVFVRHGTSPFAPVKIPDLIGIKNRKYLDHTGLLMHRSIGDLMRYSAMNVDMDFLASYDGWLPVGNPPNPETRTRFTDEQLYALALYIYSLQPPPNPNQPSALSRRGERVFRREGCGGCHAPPLYTNNKLTPAMGSQVPDEHKAKYDILPVSVGTDPTLALKTRRGTGYYKVPSLKGVWYRGPFEHSGSVMSLEDWFDPRRLGDGYVPTGFKGLSQIRAVKGHLFGLKLPAEEKAALIAFLKTL